MIFQCGGIFAILLAMLSATGALDTASDGTDIKKIIEPTSIGLATYVKDNFGLFVEKYNEQADDKTLNASSVEFEKEIYVVDSDYYAYYLDFDEENGYALFGNDYSLLSFSADGDLPYLRENGNVVFSETEGFLFIAEDGSYGKVGFEYADESTDESYGTYPDAWPNENHDDFAGGIFDPDAYINGRFGSGYYCYSTERLSGYQNVIQKDYAPIQ